MRYINHIAAFFLLLIVHSATQAQGLTINEYDLRGSWYNPATSGQGVLIDVVPVAQDQPKVVFAGWYTYSKDGSQKLWLTLFGQRTADGRVQDVEIYETRGGRFNQPPAIQSQRVGTATLALGASGTDLLVTFMFDREDPRWDRQGTMQLSKLRDKSAVKSTNRNWRASWYNEATSGQGIQIDIIGGDYVNHPQYGPIGEMSLFGAWYTFTPEGDLQWFVFAGKTAALTPDGTYDLYVTPNGRFNAGPMVGAEKVGTITLSYDYFESSPGSSDTLNVVFQFDRNDSRWTRSGGMNLKKVVPAPDTSQIIDTQNRAAVVRAYRERYLAPTPSLQWTGSTDTCNPGTLGAAYQKRVADQVNYFRSMAGVPAVALELDPAIHNELQAAALVLSAQPGIPLTHSPSPSWQCYSDAAGAGALASLAAENALNTQGGAVWLYMYDGGPNNRAVLHRRDLLDADRRFISVGDAAGTRKRNALETSGGHARAPLLEEHPVVAWPSAGYFPHVFVSERWSLGVARSDLQNASVRMIEVATGAEIPVVIEHRSNPSGAQPTLTWAPASSANLFPNVVPATDRRIRVEVSNVIVDGQPRSYEYEVIIINPN